LRKIFNKIKELAIQDKITLCNVEVNRNECIAVTKIQHIFNNWIGNSQQQRFFGGGGVGGGGV